MSKHTNELISMLASSVHRVSEAPAGVWLASFFVGTAAVMAPTSATLMLFVILVAVVAVDMVVGAVAAAQRGEFLWSSFFRRTAIKVVVYVGCLGVTYLSLVALAVVSKADAGAEKEMIEMFFNSLLVLFVLNDARSVVVHGEQLGFKVLRPLGRALREVEKRSAARLPAMDGDRDDK